MKVYEILSIQDDRRRNRLLRDEMMEAYLRALSEYPALRDIMTLQGGGAMHFIYDSPRYSADLDFVTGAYMADELEKYAKELLTEVDGYRVETKVRKTAKGMLRMGLCLGQKTRGKSDKKLDRLSGHLPGVSVEIFSHDTDTSKLRDTNFGGIVSESPSEILLDKIVASIDRLAVRGTIKVTDIFDMHYILTTFGDPKMSIRDIERKAVSYGSEYSDQRFDNLLAWFYDSESKYLVAEGISKCLPEGYRADVDYDTMFEKVFSSLRSIRSPGNN